MNDEDETMQHNNNLYIRIKSETDLPNFKILYFDFLSFEQVNLGLQWINLDSFRWLVTVSDTWSQELADLQVNTKTGSFAWLLVK